MWRQRSDAGMDCCGIRIVCVVSAVLDVFKVGSSPGDRSGAKSSKEKT
jgi:hypothetical protein